MSHSVWWGKNVEDVLVCPSCAEIKDVWRTLEEVMSPHHVPADREYQTKFNPNFVQRLDA